MLSIHNLSYAHQKEIVFNYPNFATSKDPLLILGASGCGKTTLLHLISGLLKPKSGQVFWSGVDITQLSKQNLDHKRGKTIGLVFQQAHFVASLNVLENICLQANINQLTINKEELSGLLKRLNISHLALKKTNQLSEGEKQRTSIARALIAKPSYLLADEPTSALDDKNAQEVINLLHQEATITGTQVLIITHDQRLKSVVKNQIHL
jgi:ABC-type lipoprotein export system ATPase subunit